MTRKLILVAGALALASISAATITQVSQGGLGANDRINWSQFGGDFTTIASGTHGFTDNGIGFTLHSVDGFANEDGGDFELRTEGSSWGGVFNVGDTVLWHHKSGNGGASYMGIYFDSFVGGVGAMFTSNLYGQFEGDGFHWDSFPGGSFQGSTAVTGTMGPGPNGSAPYMGALSDTTNLGMTFWTTHMTDGQPDDLGFAINNLDVRDLGGRPVPEPASMAALGLGIAALIRKRKNSR